jgi:peroxiredoxin
MEIPTLTTMSRDFHDKGVEILGLSVEDPRESAEAVRMFATQYGIEYRLGFATDEMFEALSGPNQAQVVPQTLVFDKSGKLILHLRGLHPHFAEVLKECLEDML